jgi:hypothetical protein
MELSTKMMNKLKKVRLLLTVISVDSAVQNWNRVCFCLPHLYAYMYLLLTCLSLVDAVCTA